MKTKRRVPDKAFTSKFPIKDPSDLVRHLQSVTAAAQQMNEGAASILSVRSDIVAIARQITLYVDAQEPEARNAANERRDVIRLKRKVALFRMFLLGSKIVEVAKQFDVKRDVVRLHVNDIVRTLKVRSRMVSRKARTADPLASVEISVPLRLDEEEKKIYVAYLERFETELERRGKGLPWQAVWHENIAEMLPRNGNAPKESVDRGSGM